MRQQSVDDIKSYTVDNQRAPLSHPSNLIILVGVTERMVNDMLAASF